MLYDELSFKREDEKEIISPAVVSSLEASSRVNGAPKQYPNYPQQSAARITIRAYRQDNNGHRVLQRHRSQYIQYIMIKRNHTIHLLNGAQPFGHSFLRTLQRLQQPSIATLGEISLLVILYMIAKEVIGA
jgi:hypothetical protein